MKSLGLVRKVDRLRRIAIPIEVREILKLKNGDSLEFFEGDEGVVIRKYTPSLKD